MFSFFQKGLFRTYRLKAVFIKYSLTTQSVNDYSQVWRIYYHYSNSKMLYTIDFVLDKNTKHKEHEGDTFYFEFII